MPELSPYTCPLNPQDNVCTICQQAMSQRDQYLRELIDVRKKLQSFTNSINHVAEGS
jgi:hypothetical protein